MGAKSRRPLLGHLTWDECWILSPAPPRPDPPPPSSAPLLAPALKSPYHWPSPYLTAPGLGPALPHPVSCCNVFSFHIPAAMFQQHSRAPSIPANQWHQHPFPSIRASRPVPEVLGRQTPSRSWGTRSPQRSHTPALGDDRGHGHIKSDLRSISSTLKLNTRTNRHLIMALARNVHESHFMSYISSQQPPQLKSNES